MLPRSADYNVGAPIKIGTLKRNFVRALGHPAFLRLYLSLVDLEPEVVTLVNLIINPEMFPNLLNLVETPTPTTTMRIEEKEKDEVLQDHNASLKILQQQMKRLSSRPLT